MPILPLWAYMACCMKNLLYYYGFFVKEFKELRTSDEIFFVYTENGRIKSRSGYCVDYEVDEVKATI